MRRHRVHRAPDRSNYLLRLISSAVSGTKHGYLYGTANPLPQGGVPGAPKPLPDRRGAGVVQPGPPEPLPNPRLS